jgi:hypothetical protein
VANDFSDVDGSSKGERLLKTQNAKRKTQKCNTQNQASLSNSETTLGTICPKRAGICRNTAHFGDRERTIPVSREAILLTITTELEPSSNDSRPALMLGMIVNTGQSTSFALVCIELCRARRTHPNRGYQVVAAVFIFLYVFKLQIGAFQVNALGRQYDSKKIESVSIPEPKVLG